MEHNKSDQQNHKYVHPIDYKTLTVNICSLAYKDYDYLGNES